MDDDGAGLILLLVFGGFILVAVAAYFTLQALVAVLAWAYENREDIEQAMAAMATAIGKALLAPHQAAVAVTLYVCRDLPVKYWPPQYSAREERWAVVAWMVVMPIILSLTWLVAITWCFSWLIPWMGISASLGLASTITVVICYYRHYFDRPPQHHNWPLFLAQENSMRFDASLAYIERRAQLQLWWRSLWR